MKHPCYFIAILLLFSSCLKEEELKKPFTGYGPVQLDDGWEISAPDAEGVDPDALTQIYSDYHSDESIWQVRSLLVFRNGKLIAESYTKDDNDRTTPRAVWSCTKQVVALLTGIAIDKQLIDNVNDSISAYIPETGSYPDKKNIRIEHLLTMRSGIAYSNDGLKGQSDDILRQLPDKITDFILDRPLAYIPGEMAAYKDCDPQLIAAAIQNRCGMTTAQWAKEVLFDPLEIKYLDWHNYKDGVTFGGFGILTTPRELAKFGQCVLEGGRWKGKPVVSQQWIEEMTTTRVEDMYSYQFGYLWWIDESRDLVFMNGHGGQYVFVIPSKNLLVVMTAEVNTQGDFQFNNEEALQWVDRILQTSK